MDKETNNKLPEDFGEPIEGDILKTYVLFILLTFSSYLVGFSQSNFNSLDTPVDARSISLGESFVALSNSSSGSFYNPATLNSIDGITASFSKRYFDYSDFTKGMYYFSLNSTVHTPYGTFGLFYNIYNSPGLNIRAENNLLEEHPYYNHTYGIGYAKEIIPNLSTGISLKTYDFAVERTYSSMNINQFKTTSKPFIFDVGVLYRLPINVASDNFTNELSLGLSLQNFGTDYRVDNHYYQVPHYARLGFAYIFNSNKKQKGDLQPFRYTLTGEYCNQINSWKTMQYQIDYWKAGMEATFYEIVSLRIGGYAQPYNTIYGKNDTPLFRYGFGLNAPFHSIGINIPIVVVFDFAVIPLSQTNIGLYYNPKKNLTTFSLELKYSNDLF